MTHDEMINLIQAGVTEPGGTWADLGAGAGNFTRALASLLGSGTVIHAIDHAAYTSKQDESFQGVTIHWQRGDFLTSLPLADLDGVLMANALHFVRDPESVLHRVMGYLKSGGRFLLVEYAVSAPLGYVPHPVPYERFVTLCAQVGLSQPAQIGFRRSPRTGIAMYAAVAIRSNIADGKHAVPTQQAPFTP